MTHYNVGIDTGGTYTDAVIVDTQQQQVVASAKALTTRGDLALGVIAALEQVLQASQAQLSSADISLVSLSTTLATNALVEGKGSNIAVVLIGFDDTMAERTELSEAIPAAKVIRIAGGHRYDGAEQAPLDEAALKAALTAIEGQVEAFAVSAAYSVRNPQHEHRAQAIIREQTGCPVTASCDLSEALNGPRRALTAAFNTRIIAMIVALVDSVRRVMQEQGIDAPLMIVKGDGSLASADSVVEKPIETILSGPAASVIGANFLSGLQDFIISDIGGTTTDVAIVRDGWPELNDKGAMVGEHRTMVKAIDMQTIGLGGDSEVSVAHDGRIVLQANRVVPVSLLGAQWPSVRKALQSCLDEGIGLGMGSLFVMRPTGHAALKPRDLSTPEQDLFDAIGEEPTPWTAVVSSIRDRYRLVRLVERGLVQLAGFTPSDAAHVLGIQSQWSREVALLACLMLGRFHGKVSFDDRKIEADCQAFAQEIFDATVARSVHIMVERLSNCHFAANDPLVSLIAQGKQYLGALQVSLQPTIPLVAVGGPAPVFYPEVGRRLGVETVIPAGSEVANAIGAAIGLIRTPFTVEITTAEQGGYHLHVEGEPLLIQNPTEALAKADELARQVAERQAVAAGGAVLQTDVNVERLDIPGIGADKGLISAKVRAECLSRPVLR